MDEQDISPDAKKRASELLDKELAGVENWPLPKFEAVHLQYRLNRLGGPRRDMRRGSYHPKTKVELQKNFNEQVEIACESFTACRKDIENIGTRAEAFPPLPRLAQEREVLRAICWEGQLRVDQMRANLKEIMRRSCEEPLSLSVLRSTSDALSVLHGQLADLAGACVLQEIRVNSLHLQNTDNNGRSEKILQLSIETLGDSAIVRAPNSKPYVAVQKAISQDTWSGYEDSVQIYDDEIYSVKFCPPDLLPGNYELKSKGKPSPIVADVLDIIYWAWLELGETRFIAITDEVISVLRGTTLAPKTLKIQQRAMFEARSLRMTKLAGKDVDLAVLNWDALPYGKPLGPRSQPQIYLAEPGPVLQHSLQAYGSHNPRNGAFYSPGIWRLRSPNWAIAKNLARSLRCDWRLHPEQYMPSADTPRYRSWRDHLNDAGLNVYSIYRGHPYEFITAIRKQVDELVRHSAISQWQVKGRNELLHHPDDRSALIGLQRGQGTLDRFLDLRVLLPPPESVYFALQKNVMAKRAGYIAQKKKR